tara:strand:- start:278 stop:1816 length:1539 start_codon:yes stop_codon:yes gene_type:complete
MKLSDEQKVILDYSLTDDWDILIINGPAGSGKTTLLNLIYQEFKKNKPNCRLYPAAYTGRAAAVLKEKGLENSKTINFWIWGRRSMYRAFDKFFKLEIMKEERDEVSDELWIIDEGSMIQENLLTHLLDEVHNQDRNPRLHLYKAKLNDLVEDKFFSIKHNRKIILCGDQNQLPPIYAKAGKHRPALDKSVLEKLTKRVKHFDLSELHRHKYSEDIHELAKNLETTNNINDLDIDSFSKENVEIIENNTIDNLMTKYLSSFKKNPHQTKYISFNNQVAHEFNILARNAIHSINPRELYVEKDLMHVTENNYFHSLWNGDFLEVLKVGNTIEGPKLHIKSSIIKKDDEEFTVDKEFSLNFTRLTLRHIETNKIHYEVLVIDETLNNEDEDNWIYSNREDRYFEIEEYLHEFFMQRNPEYPELTREEKKELRETDKYNNALYMNYSYAITGHKSQGGEWDYVFVDFTTVIKDKETGKYNIKNNYSYPPGWKYTAATRASKKVFLIPERETLILT